MEDPENFQGNFLFVNKNAMNVSSRSPEEAFTIGSHVCGKYARWRKVARLKPRRIIRFAHSGLPKISSNLNQVNRGHDRATKVIEQDGATKVIEKGGTTARGDGQNTSSSRWRANRAPVSSIPLSTARPPAKPSTPATDEGEAVQGSRRHFSQHMPGWNTEATKLAQTELNQHSKVFDRKFGPSPRSILQKGNSDPFSAAVLPISPSMSFLINVWQGVYLETVWPVDAGAASRTPALLSWQNDCHDTIANEARLHGLLTWTLMLQISSLPESSNRSKLLLDCFVHKSKCLASLRRDLSQGARHLHMVPVLWHLTGAEFYAGDVSTATVHFTALKAMVESGGGLQALSWALQKLVIVADMTLSQVKMAPPFFSVDQWDPRSIAPKLSRAEAEILARSPQLIGNSHYELPERVTDIFRDYRELLAVYELVDVIPDEFRRTELLCWAQLRQYALNLTVTGRRIDIAAAPVPAGNRVSELCICVAVDYFQQLIWHTRYKARTDHVPFHHPQPSFDDLLPNKDLVSPHLTAWIYFLAATVEQIDCCQGQQKKTGHFHRFFALMRKSGLRSAQDLRRVFNNFLYHSETLDRYLFALLARAERFVR